MKKKKKRKYKQKYVHVYASNDGINFVCLLQNIPLRRGNILIPVRNFVHAYIEISKGDKLPEIDLRDED